MTRDTRKADARTLLCSLVMGLASLLLLAVQPVLAGDALSPLDGNTGSESNSSPQWLQPKTATPLNQTPRDVIDVRITDNLQCIQQRLSEINGKPMSLEDASSWAAGQAGHSLARRDYPVTGGEKRGAQLAEKYREDNKKGYKYDGKQDLSISSSENGAVSVTTKQYKALSVDGDVKYPKKFSKDTALTRENGFKSENKVDIGVNASGSTSVISGKIETKRINEDGTSYIGGSVQGAGPKFEGKVSAGTNGVGASAGVSALSATASVDGGVFSGDTYKGVKIEAGGDLGIGAEYKLGSDGVKAKGSFGALVGFETENGKLPGTDNYRANQTLHEVGYTTKSLKHLPNKSEPSQLNTMLGDCERLRGETRGNEAMFERDPKQTDGHNVPETPMPDSGVLSKTQGSSPDAQDDSDKRQSMKDEFNRNKQQYQDAAARRQAEQAAQAAQQQNNGQMQDFMSIMNIAITAGSAARTAPSSSTAGSTLTTPSTTGSNSTPKVCSLGDGFGGDLGPGKLTCK